ncbi:hypothetical protein GCM10007962_16330 [Yeosuana aromativorans]|uniref:Secreted protein (Por secretion system target) n=1 Tax=Yeosuana aromativorans TaxID=288019 RepID=A0A8J3BN32_9FLAO|nr:T9SS type A sorting domain-containing protein [Yeosuana aromativorans]GGK22848.1 hypothetical protein GCM10007962_16330 [Yeosuana aromativorans]
MKKLYILFFTILISGVSFGQSVFINEIHYDDSGASDSGEGFEIAGPAGTDLSTYTVTLYNGSNSSAYNTIGLSGTIPDEGGSGYGAVWFGLPTNGMQNGSPDGLSLDNGGTLIQFLSYEGTITAIGGAADTVLSTDIGVSETNSTPVGYSLQLTGSGTDYTNFTWATESAATHGAINTGQTFGTPVPSLTISDGPANGDTLVGDPETATANNANVDFTTTNFDMSNDAGGGVSDNSGDGYIIWSVENTNGNVFVDGGSVFTSNDPNTTYPITGLAVGETYFFRAELVDNNGDPLSSPIVYSFTMTIATYTDVPDLATLRSQVVDPDLYYRVTGPVINTWSVPDTALTMYFQDGTAGIMVYDPNYSTHAYNTGDAVSNIRGHLEEVSGVLQLIPSDADWATPTTTGNSPAVPTVTIATLLTNWNDYESQLVNINNATFADAGGTFVTAIGSTGNYNISDSSGTTIFRSAFSNADYIGSTIPSGNQNLVVIVSEYFGTVQVTSRSLSDITLDSKSFELNSFKMYPNPTSLGYVKLLSKNNAPMTISVFDMLGKQVLHKAVKNNTLDVSSLKTGLYLMKVSQDNASITKKLVVQ